MGMFDYVVCKYSLPQGFTLGVGEVLQTKSFSYPERGLLTYTLDEQGRLIDPKGVQVTNLPELELHELDGELDETSSWYISLEFIADDSGVFSLDSGSFRKLGERCAARPSMDHARS